jgi:hypothetical protein
MDHLPNADLSSIEKYEKIQLKRLLKLQHRRHKLETRLRLAEQRQNTYQRRKNKKEDNDDHLVADPDHSKNEALIIQTRKELDALQIDELNAGVIRQANLKAQQHQQHLQEEDDEEKQDQRTRKFIANVYYKLQRTWTNTIVSTKDEITSKSPKEDAHHHNPTNPQYVAPQIKQQRLESSRQLLSNMTKGKQALEDFVDNIEGLQGYTQQKFIERAVLIASAIRRAQHYFLQNSTGSSTITTSSPMFALDSIRSIASIGCGPGCDAVGVIAAAAVILNGGKASINNDITQKEFVLDRVLLLDWAMDHWKPILTSVRDILIEEHLIQSMDMASCDVRVSLFKQQNQMAVHDNDVTNTVFEHSCSQDVISLLTNAKSQESATASTVNERRLAVNMFVISYLLSETRGQWHHLLDDVVQQSVPGTAFLLTDPTAWQLHAFRRRYEFSTLKERHSNKPHRQFHFVWLDSSMDRPELQVLEGRIGPAILMGIKLEPQINPVGI